MFESPGLNCASCREKQRDPECGATPLCLTAAGCPIEDVAADPDIQETIDKFLLAKHLYRLTGDPTVQAQTFKELGLYNDPETHVQLEAEFAKWWNQTHGAAQAMGLNPQL